MHDMSNEALDRAVRTAGSQSALARLVGVRQNSIWAALQKGRVSAELAIRIERALGGAVRAQDLRPDLFGGGVTPADAPRGATAVPPSRTASRGV